MNEIHYSFLLPMNEIAKEREKCHGEHNYLWKRLKETTYQNKIERW
jgi:hypothetical protein